MKTYAYIRCSSVKQDEQSQRQIIKEWQKSTGNKVDEVVTDQASGGVAWQQRGIAAALDACKAGDCIVVSEVSRIARSTVGVLTFLQAAAEKQISVIAVRSGISLDGSGASKIVVTVLAMAAEIERDMLRSRTKAALAARKAQGVILGRPVGSRSTSKLDEHAEEIRKMRAARISQAGIARVLGCSRQTVITWLQHNPINQETEAS